MRTKIAVIGEDYFTSGFELAGLQDVFTLPLEEQKVKIKELINSKEFGIIFISDSTYASLDHKLKKVIDNISFPLIISLPDIKNREIENENIKEMVKRALGFDVFSK